MDIIIRHNLFSVCEHNILRHMPIVFLSYKLEIDRLVFLSGMYVHSIDLLHMLQLVFSIAHLRIDIMPNLQIDNMLIHRIRLIVSVVQCHDDNQLSNLLEHFSVRLRHNFHALLSTNQFDMRSSKWHKRCRLQRCLNDSILLIVPPNSHHPSICCTPVSAQSRIESLISPQRLARNLIRFLVGESLPN